MPIPNVNELMGPVLETLGDSEIHAREEIIDKLSVRFGLTDADLQKTIKDTQNSVFGNHIDWVRSYFTQHGLIETPQKGISVSRSGA